MSLSHLFGFDGQEWYSFWSGLGADLGQVVLLGGAVAFYRKHECHVKGCHRLGRQKIAGKEWVVCHKHHPDGEASAEAIAEHVRSTRDDRDGAGSRPGGR